MNKCVCFVVCVCVLFHVYVLLRLCRKERGAHRVPMYVVNTCTLSNHAYCCFDQHVLCCFSTDALVLHTIALLFMSKDLCVVVLEADITVVTLLVSLTIPTQVCTV